MLNSTFERGLIWHKFQLSGLRSFIKMFFYPFQWEQFLSLCKSIILIVCYDLRISCNNWSYFLFDKICMSPRDMICISKTAINFNPLISIKANGIRGTQREYSSKQLKHSIVKGILVFKRWIWAYFYPL